MTTERNTPEEQDIARLLQAAGKREELPEHIAKSWEASFREQLAPVIQRRKWRQHRQVFALCASLACVALLGVFTLQWPPGAALDMSISRTLGNAFVSAPGGTATPAQIDQVLEVGSVLTTPAHAYLSLRYQGYDLRLNSRTEVRVQGDGVHLLAGEIYVNNETGSTPAAPIVVHTPYATVSDIGTQFTVALVGDAVISTVRKGTILVNTGASEHREEAGDNPHRVVVNKERELSAGETGPEQWSWIYPLAPRFETDGSSAYEFLQWSVAETGLQLAFATDSAETYARITTLRGNVPNLDPEQHLALVLATTHLQVTHGTANTLLVELMPR